MSVSQSQTLSHSDMQHELKEILHGVEKAHKADIQTYSSGHLGPHSVTHGPLNCSTYTSTWNKPKCKDMGPGCIQESSKKIANVVEPADALHRFGLRTTPEEPRIQKRPASLNEKLPTTDLIGVHDMTELTKLSSASQERCAVSDIVERDSCCVTHSHEARVTRSDRSCRRLRTDTWIVRTKDLTTRKCLSGREAATRHEHKLQQALRKLPAGGGPCRERLTVFSDVFNDVCDGSPAFGSILRDIKTEYDLYVKSLLSAQSPPQDKFLPTSFGVSTEAITELKEAAKEVLLLEQEARRALEENNRVRTECEDAQAKALVDQKEKNSCETVGQCNELGSPEVTECELSSMAQVEVKRRQVWKVWNDVQKLEKDIREKMVSIVTTGALENCIRDSEDDIFNFTASTVFLQRSNKDLERNTSSILSKAKVDEETTAQVWEEIWTTLNGSQ